jgi:sporulation integral membrane protein YlbJ
MLPASQKSLIMPLLLIAAGIGVFALMLYFPEESLRSAIRGLTIWWDVLFPALFPFFVISEMLLGLGIVHFIGAWLDPLMRPLFRVPGIGGFVMAMGFASGYPVGARLTAKLWEDRLVTRDEGERLVAFTTSSDPIFLIGAVSVGFFHHPQLAAVLAAAHYGASILIGLLMRFHGKKDRPLNEKTAAPAGLSGRLRYSLTAMHQARMSDGRAVSELLFQSVRNSLRLMMVVGGLVVFFSTLLELLTRSQLMNVLYASLQFLLDRIGLPITLAPPIVNGLFEVTLGAQSAGSAEGGVRLIDKAAVAAFVLSWGGLSVHAQIMSILNRTDLRYRPLVFARLAHGIMSAVLVYLVWEPLKPASVYLGNVIAVFAVSDAMYAAVPFAAASALIFTAALLAIVLISLGWKMIQLLSALVPGHEKPGRGH